MPDIIMCTNIECPLKNDCYRFNAIPNGFRQSYDQFEPILNDELKVECEHYIEPQN